MEHPRYDITFDLFSLVDVASRCQTWYDLMALQQNPIRVGITVKQDGKFQTKMLLFFLIWKNKYAEAGRGHGGRRGASADRTDADRLLVRRRRGPATVAEDVVAEVAELHRLGLVAGVDRLERRRAARAATRPPTARPGRRHLPTHGRSPRAARRKRTPLPLLCTSTTSTIELRSYCSSLMLCQSLRKNKTKQSQILTPSTAMAIDNNDEKKGRTERRRRRHADVTGAAPPPRQPQGRASAVVGHRRRPASQRRPGGGEPVAVGSGGPVGRRRRRRRRRQ